MHYADFSPSDLESQNSWKRTHPVPLLARDSGIGEREPLFGKPVTNASLDKIAPAVSRVVRELKFDVACDHLNSPASNRFYGLARLGAVRDDVTGAYN